MKISFMLPWNQDIPYWLQWADDHGIEGVELVYASHDAPTSYEFKPDEIKAALEGKKVKVCATTMFWINSLAKDSEERARAREFKQPVQSVVHMRFWEPVVMNRRTWRKTLRSFVRSMNTL